MTNMDVESKKLYVGNLSHEITESELEDFFKTQEINVTRVLIIKDKYTEKSKGFGFAELITETDTQKAIDSLNGRGVTVIQACRLRHRS